MATQDMYIETVKRYLDASAARRLDEASYLTSGAERVFPDGRFAMLDLVSWVLGWDTLTQRPQDPRFLRHAVQRLKQFLER